MKYEHNYLDYLVQNRETEFRVKAEAIYEPHFVGYRQCTVMKLLSIICDGNVVPGPVAVEPVVIILD